MNEFKLTCPICKGTGITDKFLVKDSKQRYGCDYTSILKVCPACRGNRAFDWLENVTKNFSWKENQYSSIVDDFKTTVEEGYYVSGWDACTKKYIKVYILKREGP